MVRMLTLTIAGALLSLSTVARAQDSRPQDPFLGVDGCKSCHAEVVTAWSRTKHARAMDALTGNDRTNASCVSCHITATRESVSAQLTNPQHPNVQCEACHGPGRAHAERAAGGTPAPAGITRTPNEKVCVECHNSKSPSFKGFFYNAMKGLVHKH